MHLWHPMALPSRCFAAQAPQIQKGHLLPNQFGQCTDATWEIYPSIIHPFIHPSIFDYIGTLAKAWVHRPTSTCLASCKLIHMGFPLHPHPKAAHIALWFDPLIAHMTFWKGALIHRVLKTSWGWFSLWQIWQENKHHLQVLFMERNFSYIYQFEVQDPKTMDVQYHIRPYVVGIYYIPFHRPNIDLKSVPLI